MPTFEGQFVSIVLLGRQNPQILNHDFLVNNRILPEDQEPFSDFLKREPGQQYSQFISLPVLSTIAYGPISITVQENTFQIKDDRFQDPAGSPIISVVRKYFGAHLKYTPFHLGGFNLHGLIRYSDDEDERKLDEHFGVNRTRVKDIAGSDDVHTSLALRSPWHKGTMEVRLTKPAAWDNTAEFNFNYEFAYADIDSFLRNLDDAGMIYRRFMELLRQVGVEGV